MVTVASRCRLSILGVVIFFANASGGQIEDRKAQQFRELVDASAHTPVTGASVGPSKGISDNSATRKVVGEGQAIVSALVSALDRSSWAQSVWIVFCLRELRATSAEDRVLRLRDELEHEKRFANEPHDFTLNVQIRAFLADIPKWKDSLKGTRTQDRSLPAGNH